MTQHTDPSTADSTQRPSAPRSSATDTSTASPDLDTTALTDGEWDLLRFDVPDTEFTVEETRDDRAVVKWLVALRERRDITQRQVAEGMHCSDSTVSRIESGLDRHLGLAETAGYLRALGLDCHLQVSDDTMPHDVQLRRTVLLATRLLTRLHYLLRIRGNDDTSLPELNAFIAGVLAPLLLEAVDSGNMERDAVKGDMPVELAPRG